MLEVMKRSHADPKRANQGTTVTERGQVKEGEDEEPINRRGGRSGAATLDPRNILVMY